MRAVRIEQDICDKAIGTPLRGGEEYLVPDHVAADWLGWRSFAANFAAKLATAKDDAERERFAADREEVEAKAALGRARSRPARELLRLWRSPEDLQRKRLLFLDGMGLGDFLMMAPLLRKLKGCWPKVHIGTACHRRYMTLLYGIPWIDEVLPWPIAASEAARWDYHVSYERLFEDDPRAKTMHACSLFGEVVNLPVRPEEMVVDFLPGHPKMPDWFAPTFPQGKRPEERWVGLFLAGSAPHKNWPADYILQLTHALCLTGYSVFWLGAPGDSFAVGRLQPSADGHRFAGFLRGPLGHLDLCGKFPDLRQLAAFCRDYVDLIISPDSFGSHLGGALGIPTIALYGPFNPELLTSHYSNVLALQGKEPCAPCMQHGARMPCVNELGERRQRCQALDNIYPEAVYQYALRMCPRPSAIPEDHPTPSAPPSRIVRPASPAGRGHAPKLVIAH